MALICCVLIGLVVGFAMTGAVRPSIPTPEAVLTQAGGGDNDGRAADSRAEAGTQADPLQSSAEYAEGATKEPSRALTWSNGAPYRAEEVLVELADGKSADDLNAQIGSFDFVKTPSIANGDVALGWAKLELDPGTDVASAIEQLEAADVIAGAQPNFIYHAMEDAAPAVEATTPANAAAEGASSLAATSLLQASSTEAGWQLNEIKAYDAWNTRKTQHATTVAIIDSGCDVGHPALKGNVIGAHSVLDNSSNVPDATGHGTHVAGIISAIPGKKAGVEGVSYNAYVMPIKVMNGDTTDTMNLVKAYDYLIANAGKYAVRVVNVSLGAESNSLDASDQATLRAVDKAYFAGILSVFAGGNKDSGKQTIPYYCFPCDFAETGVGVVNVDDKYQSSGKPASNSNYNKPGEKTKDLAAPGTRIYSTVPKGEYKSMTGTSMATPVVSGVAALVFAQNPSLNAGEAKSVLCSTAQDIATGAGKVGFDDYTGYGLVRADLAVQGAKQAYIKGGDALAEGGSLKLSVPQPGTWSWSSDSTGIAQVNASTGVVTGIGHGEAVISATNGTTTLHRTIVVYETKFNGVNSVPYGRSAPMGAWANPVAAWTYRSSNSSVASVDDNGFVTGKKLGVATITATLSACPNIQISKQITIVKASNPMNVVAKTKKVKYKKVRAKKRTVKNAIVFTKKAVGKVTYKKVSKGSSKRLSINKKTGVITVKKGTKRGTYKIKVRIKAAGNSKYLAKTTELTVKIKVK